MAASKLALRLFGKHVQKRKYEALSASLRKARMPVSADVYAATSMLYSILSLPAGAIIGFLMGWLLKLGLPLILVLALVFAGIFAGLAYVLLISYPSMLVSDRTRKLDAALPHAIGFMHAMSRSGATIVDIFRELSQRTDVGPIADEAKVFMRDIEYLGRDPLTSLRSLARTTPSEKFRSLLEVLVSIIETGGEVTPYFASKSLELREERKIEQKRTISTLEFSCEIFIILVVFMPLLILSIVLFMSGVQAAGVGFDERMVVLIAYGWIPLGSLMFAVLVSTASPERIRGRPRPIGLPFAYREVVVTEGGPADRALLRRLRGTFWQAKLKSFLANPFAVFARNPSYVFFLSIPLATIYLLLKHPWYTADFFYAFAIASIPYAIAHGFRERRAKLIDEALPDFLKTLATASRSGLGISRSIAVASTSELGPLTDEIKRTKADMDWGSSSVEALSKLEERVAISDTAARTTALIRKAAEAEENISDVVAILQEDVGAERTLEKDRSSAMLIYKVILLMCFLVFLITVYFLVDAFLYAGVTLPAGVTIEKVKMWFYHLMLIQAGCSGFLAAQIGEGDLRGGVKYAVGMMLLAWLLFEFVVLPKPIRPPAPVEAIAIPFM